MHQQSGYYFDDAFRVLGPRAECAPSPRGRSSSRLLPTPSENHIIPRMANYRYWTVECKTPGCGIILLDKIGPTDPFRIPFLPECRDFAEKCSGCLAVYSYTHFDVRWRDAPLQEFRASRPFRAATQPLPQQDESQIQ